MVTPGAIFTNLSTIAFSTTAPSPTTTLGKMTLLTTFEFSLTRQLRETIECSTVPLIMLPDANCAFLTVDSLAK